MSIESSFNTGSPTLVYLVGSPCGRTSAAHPMLCVEAVETRTVARPMPPRGASGPAPTPRGGTHPHLLLFRRDRLASLDTGLQRAEPAYRLERVGSVEPPGSVTGSVDSDPAGLWSQSFELDRRLVRPHRPATPRIVNLRRTCSHLNQRGRRRARWTARRIPRPRHVRLFPQARVRSVHLSPVRAQWPWRSQAL